MHATDALRAVLRFSEAILREHRTHMGSLDGGYVQDVAVQHGLLVEVRVYRPCSEHGCACVDYYDISDDGRFLGDARCLRVSDIFTRAHLALSGEPELFQTDPP